MFSEALKVLDENTTERLHINGCDSLFADFVCRKVKTSFLHGGYTINYYKRLKR